MRNWVGRRNCVGGEAAYRKNGAVLFNVEWELGAD